MTRHSAVRHALTVSIYVFASPLATAPSLAGSPSLTAFTYQGRLTDGGTLANGTYDLLFSVWDQVGDGNPPVGGNQIGTFFCVNDIAIVDGLCTAQLDFGEGVFRGEPRWLQIGVRLEAVATPCDTGAYTTLAPRQALTGAPLAMALPGLRTEYNNVSPNIIGGWTGNSAASNVVGATIAGGGQNVFGNHVSGDYAAIGGGGGNSASGHGATVPGGERNHAAGVWSLAAGYRAHAEHIGTFVWADSNGGDFESTADDQFLIRAAGGVGIGTASPTDMVQIDAPTGVDALRVRVAGSTKLRVHSNGGVSTATAACPLAATSKAPSPPTACASPARSTSTVRLMSKATPAPAT